MENQREHFAVKDMENFAYTVLVEAGYSDEAAMATVYALLEADKRGIYSHGIAGGTGLEEAVVRTGITATVEMDAEPIFLEQKYPTIGVIDGNGAPGHITAQRAVTKVKELAREYGIAKVFVHNTNHYGAAGVWSEMIAAEGDLKGEVSCTTHAVARVMGDDPERLDYTKGAGTEERMGTNPLAISIPHTEGILTLDMAFTKMAVSYCFKHLKAGSMMQIPEYIADNSYKSTLNPQDFVLLEDFDNVLGTVFPLGSTHSGYKGDSMLRMLEIDQAIGGGPTVKIPLGGTSDKRRISHSFQAQTIDFLYSKEQVTQRVSELMHDYENKYFGSASRWPGDRSQQALEYVKTEGIPYSEGQIATLRRAAEVAGVNFDETLQSFGKKKYPVDVFNK
ncbi:MAG: Ldh family oxidoreductase [Candidatus Kariarchaeaceae archaeon]|jgi:LDH2 family malate/lactate/ureidoglycolate dehydrogenase